MLRVFISYRRDDSGPIAGRLFDHLAREFGEDHVFRDIYSIAPGDDFAKTIDARLKDCDVCLVVIGSRWLEPDAATKRPRLDAPGDFVRLEIETAFNNKVRVIPVLIDQAKMPSAQQLPKSLAPLVRRHAAKLLDSHWEHDVAQLADTIVNAPDETGARSGRSAWLGRALMAANACAIIGVGLELTTPLMGWSAIVGWLVEHITTVGSIAAGLAAVAWFIVRGGRGRLAYGVSVAVQKLQAWSEHRWTAFVLAGLLLVLAATIWMIPEGVTIRETSGVIGPALCEPRFYPDTRMDDTLVQQCDGNRDSSCGAAAFNCRYYELRIFTGLFRPSTLDVTWRIAGVQIENGVESRASVSWADAVLDRTDAPGWTFRWSADGTQLLIEKPDGILPRTVTIRATWQYDPNTIPVRIETAVAVGTGMSQEPFEATKSFTMRN